MVDEINSALINLFLCDEIEELAVDIYWGSNNHFSEEEKDAFDEEDCEIAYMGACIKMIERVRYGNDFPYENPEKQLDNSIAWDKMICALGELFGQELRLMQISKSLGGDDL